MRQYELNFKAMSFSHIALVQFYVEPDNDFNVLSSIAPSLYSSKTLLKFRLSSTRAANPRLFALDFNKVFHVKGKERRLSSFVPMSLMWLFAASK